MSTSPIRRYRGPLLLVTAVVVATLLWGWAQLQDVLGHSRHVLVLHSRSLMEALDGHVGDGELHERRARVQALIESRLRIQPPFRFVALYSAGEPLASVGVVPADLSLPARLGITDMEASHGLVVVHNVIGAPRDPGWFADPATRDVPPPPTAWHWAPLRAQSKEPLELYLGLEAALPPHRIRRMLRSVVPTIGSAWIAAVAFALAWARSMRSRALTAALEREQRRRAQLEELGLAAAGLAHETMNPLGLIHGMAQQLASSAEVHASSRRTGELIIDEADRAVARLSDFINYARRREAKTVATRLDEVIRSVGMTLEPEFDAKGVTLEVSPARCTVHCDARMTEQIIVNLLLNALDASAEGTTTTLSCEQDEAREVVWLHVCDQGRGIPPELMDTLFRPYVSGRPGGHGLGLAIVKRLAEQQGWEIEVTSSPGEGTQLVIGPIRLAKEVSP